MSQYNYVKCLYVPISKIHSTLNVPDLLALDNITISHYGQVNSLRLKLSEASKWTSKIIWGTIYFVVDDAYKSNMKTLLNVILAPACYFFNR